MCGGPDEEREKVVLRAIRTFLRACNVRNWNWRHAGKKRMAHKTREKGR